MSLHGLLQIPPLRPSGGENQRARAAFGQKVGRIRLEDRRSRCCVEIIFAAAGPAFFVSAWLLMLFAGIIGTEVGIRPFGYLTSMVMTIVLWLTLAPAIGAIARTGKAKKC